MGVEHRRKKELSEDIKSPLISKLLETQRNSTEPDAFEKTIAEAFDFLGMPAKHIGGRDEPDILIEKYSIILDGKSTKEGNITSESAIGFDRLERYKMKYDVKYIGVIGPGFAEGYIRETAKKRGITLIETGAICGILQNHRIYPYEPSRIIKILFETDESIITPRNIPASTIDQAKLIKIVAKILSDMKRTGKATCSSKELQIAYSWQILNYELDDIERALKFLSAFNIVKTQNDEYALTEDVNSILNKIGLLLEAFNKIEG